MVILSPQERAYTDGWRAAMAGREFEVRPFDISVRGCPKVARAYRRGWNDGQRKRAELRRNGR